MAKRSRAVVPLADGPANRRRPPSVTLVATLYIVQSVLALIPIVAGIAAIVVPNDTTPPPELTSEHSIALFGAAFVCTGLLVAAIGLLRVRRWGWTVAMATQCMVLTLGLVTYLGGQPSFLLMTLGALSVLLLNQRDVRLIFEPAEGGGG